MIRFVGTKSRQLFLLKKYMNNQIDVTHSMNVLMNVKNADYFVHIGEYFLNACEKTNKSTDEIEFSRNIGRKKAGKKRDNFRSVAIYFITSFLNRESLEKMFGPPVYHNEFGEGFDEEDNINYNCLSYFIEINNDYYHITNDHRGTSVEVPREGDPEKIVNDIKELIDLYIEKF